MNNQETRLKERYQRCLEEDGLYFFRELADFVNFLERSKWSSSLKEFEVLREGLERQIYDEDLSQASKLIEFMNCLKQLLSRDMRRKTTVKGIFEEMDAYHKGLHRTSELMSEFYSNNIFEICRIIFDEENKQLISVNNKKPKELDSLAICLESLTYSVGRSLITTKNYHLNIRSVGVVDLCTGKNLVISLKKDLFERYNREIWGVWERLKSASISLNSDSPFRYDVSSHYQLTETLNNYRIWSLRECNKSEIQAMISLNNIDLVGMVNDYKRLLKVFYHWLCDEITLKDSESPREGNKENDDLVLWNDVRVVKENGRYKLLSKDFNDFTVTRNSAFEEVIINYEAGKGAPLEKLAKTTTKTKQLKVSLSKQNDRNTDRLREDCHLYIGKNYVSDQRDGN